MNEDFLEYLNCEYDSCRMSDHVNLLVTRENKCFDFIAC